MKSIKEIQEDIYKKTGLKTSIKKGSGSMKGYLQIRPIFQNGNYPNFPHEFINELRPQLLNFDYANKPLFCTISEVCIYQIEDNRIEYKKERKPKLIEDMGVKSWGSKNSQMRLDKKAASYAKKRRGENGDNMVKYW
jgi:hypothetical protein